MKLFCIKTLESHTGMSFERGEQYEFEKKADCLVSESGSLFTLEPDEDGLSYKTWFSEEKPQQNLITVAVHKETGKLIRGYRGQLAMADKNNFAKSIGQTGIKRTEYEFQEVDIKELLKP